MWSISQVGTWYHGIKHEPAVPVVYWLPSNAINATDGSGIQVPLGSDSWIYLQIVN